MQKHFVTFVCLLAFASFHGLAEAGELEPPGPPAPTMVTLAEIDAKLSAGFVAVAGVQKTGQTLCYDPLTHDPIDCSGTGQDGEYQMGVSVSPRFTDNGDGTVTDHLTGLIWLQDASCLLSRVWDQAVADANALASGSCGLTDGSVAGDWRLPNIREFQSLFDYSRAPIPLPAGNPFIAVPMANYWTSTTWGHPAHPEYAWYAYLNAGNCAPATKSSALNAWPVRGGR